LTLIFWGFIRDDPRHPRHPRSIDAFFAATTNCWTVYAIDNRSNLVALYILVAGTLISTLPETGSAKSGDQEITATFTGKIVFAT
jgi:hypothetical protein